MEEKQTSEDITKATSQKFDEATLADGTKVTNMMEEPFAVGQELHVILEDGLTLLHLRRTYYRKWYYFSCRRRR